MKLAFITELDEVFPIKEDFNRRFLTSPVAKTALLSEIEKEYRRILHNEELTSSELTGRKEGE